MFPVPNFIAAHGEAKFAHAILPKAPEEVWTVCEKVII
jgi:hypothetical protein